MADHKVAKLSNPNGDLAMIIWIVDKGIDFDLDLEKSTNSKRGHQSAPGSEPLEIHTYAETQIHR